MKKYLILALTAAIAAVGCSKTFEVTPTPTDYAPIGFGTWAEHLTKARTQGSSTFASGDDFAVYGYSLKSTTKTTVFDDIDVNYDGTNWTYSPARYWDQSTDSYTFYGVSPTSVGTAATVAPQTGVIESASITFAGNNNDILVADEKTVAKENYGSDVQMVFNHIASLVDFKVKKHANLGDAVVAITSFGLSNIDNTGTFAVNTYPSTHPDVQWNATAHTGAYSNTSGVISASLPTAVGTSGDFLINNLVAMPQTFRTDENIQTVSIAYTITDEASNVSTYNTSFNLKLFDNVDDTDNLDTIIGGWEAGKHYTFFITIDAQKIVFTASITDWVNPDTTGYNYLLR